MKFFYFFLVVNIILAECPNSCSGHGTCTSSGTCICNKQPGLGINQGDFSSFLYQGADCSERTCPGDVSFATIPTSSSTTSKRELFNNEYKGTEIKLGGKPKPRRRSMQDSDTTATTADTTAATTNTATDTTATTATTTTTTAAETTATTATTTTTTAAETTAATTTTTATDTTATTTTGTATTTTTTGTDTTATTTTGTAGTGTDTTATTATGTAGTSTATTTESTTTQTESTPTPIVKNITGITVTKPKAEEDKKSAEVYEKLVSSNNFGGVLKCTDSDENTYTVNVYGGGEKSLTIEDGILPEGKEISCYPTYIRNDLSLYDTIIFNKQEGLNKGLGGWYNISSSMAKYGFVKDNNFTVNLACVHNNKTNVIEEEIGIAILKNDGTNIIFNYIDKDSIPDFCFLLSLGANGDKSVKNIEMMSSELSTFIGKGKDNTYYYMKNIDYSPVVTTKTAISAKNTTTRRMLFENDRFLDDYYEMDVLDPKLLYHISNKTQLIFAVDFKSDDSVSISDIVRTINVGSTANVVSYTKENSIAGIDQVVITEQPKNVECTNIKDPGADTSKQIKPAAAAPTTCYLIYIDRKITTTNVDSFNVVLSQGGYHPLLECSGQGYCDRTTGICQCLPGYDGDACQRSSCPNGCSNHGVCQEVQKILSDPSQYPSYFAHKTGETTKLFACKCDAGHRGPDCSLLECPSADDIILKSKGVTEKLDSRDCSGRGICDYSTGLCQCFDGYKGIACEAISNFI